MMFEQLLRRLSGLESTVTSFSKAQKVLEAQVFQKAGEAHRDPGKLPGRTEDNPRGQVLAITTRSGLNMKDPLPKDNAKGKQVMVEKGRLQEDGGKSKDVEPTYVAPPPYKPPLPFPQSRAKSLPLSPLASL